MRVLDEARRRLRRIFSSTSDANSKAKGHAKSKNKCTSNQKSQSSSSRTYYDDNDATRQRGSSCSSSTGSCRDSKEDSDHLDEVPCLPCDWFNASSLTPEELELLTSRYNARASSACSTIMSEEEDDQRNSIAFGSARLGDLFQQKFGSKTSRLNLSTLEILQPLGSGTFGEVKLAKHLPTGTSVALKILSRQTVEENRLQHAVLNECEIQKRLVHPFITRLFLTLQDQHSIYLVMEFVAGGELYNLVYNEVEFDSEEDEDEYDNNNDEEDDAFAFKSFWTTSFYRRKQSCELTNFVSKSALKSDFGGLHERHVAFYMGCLAMALEYLHEDQHVLYRDLKMENVVLDAQGYPKLIDFGFAKSAQYGADSDNQDDPTSEPRHTTICGSMEYMAPEIVERKPYGKQIDIWAFGILLFELLLGRTPFVDQNYRTQMSRILREEVEFPAEFELAHPLACQLVRECLRKDFMARPQSFTAIRQSSFFCKFYPNEFAWKSLEEKQLRAPFVPRLNGQYDTSLFE